MTFYPRTLLLITSFSLFVGGSEAIADNKSVVIDADKTVKRDGLLYEVNKETPFTGKVLSKYENGRIKLEATFKDGQPEGKATAWHENGQKAREGTFKDGKEDGKGTKWYENGQMKSEITYKDGKIIAEKRMGQRR